MNDEDFFSDDTTLDALGEHELRALEEEAVKSTQQHFAHNDDCYVHPPRYHYQNPPQHMGARTTAFKPPRQQNVPQREQRSNYQRPSTNYVSYSQQRGAATTSNHPHLHQQPFVPPHRGGHTYTEEPTLPAHVSNTAMANYQGPVTPLDDVSSDYGDIDGLEESTELWEETAPTALNAHNEVQEYPVIGGGAGVYQHAEGAQDWIEQQEELGQIADDVVMANSQYDAGDTNDYHRAEQQQQVDVEVYMAQIAQVCCLSSCGVGCWLMRYAARETIRADETTASASSAGQSRRSCHRTEQTRTNQPRARAEIGICTQSARRRRAEKAVRN